MGAYLSNGIALNITIAKRKNGEFTVKEKKDELLKQINNYVDISHYDIEYDDEYLSLSIKKEIFNDNIHELLKEMEPLTSGNMVLLCNIFHEITKNKEIDVYSDNFNKKNYPIILEDCDKYHKYIIRGDMDMHEHTLYSYNSWLIYNGRELIRNFAVYIDALTIWLAPDKYIGEDATIALEVLNTLKTKYYTTKLSKDLIYYVD